MNMMKSNIRMRSEENKSGGASRIQLEDMKSSDGGKKISSELKSYRLSPEKNEGKLDVIIDTKYPNEQELAGEDRDFEASPNYGKFLKV